VLAAINHLFRLRCLTLITLPGMVDAKSTRYAELMREVVASSQGEQRQTRSLAAQTHVDRLGIHVQPAKATRLENERVGLNRYDRLTQPSRSSPPNTHP
jgi:hypothetical protein